MHGEYRWVGLPVFISGHDRAQGFRTCARLTMSSSERTLRHPALSLSCLCSLALSIFPACSVDLSTLRGRPHNDASLDVPTGNGTGDAIGKFDELPLADLQPRNQQDAEAPKGLDGPSSFEVGPTDATARAFSTVFVQVPAVRRANGAVAPSATKIVLLRDSRPQAHRNDSDSRR